MPLSFWWENNGRSLNPLKVRTPTMAARACPVVHAIQKALLLGEHGGAVDWDFVAEVVRRTTVAWDAQPARFGATRLGWFCAVKAAESIRVLRPAFFHADASLRIEWTLPASQPPQLTLFVQLGSARRVSFGTCESSTEFVDDLDRADPEVWESEFLRVAVFIDTASFCAMPTCEPTHHLSRSLWRHGVFADRGFEDSTAEPAASPPLPMVVPISYATETESAASRRPTKRQREERTDKNVIAPSSATVSSAPKRVASTQKGLVSWPTPRTPTNAQTMRRFRRPPRPMPAFNNNN
jgi:hypothetical protein